MYLFGVFAFGSVNKKQLESKFEIFKSYGWDESDILTMARANPNYLHGIGRQDQERFEFLNE